jgi:hypothetical protein
VTRAGFAASLAALAAISLAPAASAHPGAYASAKSSLDTTALVLGDANRSTSPQRGSLMACAPVVGGPVVMGPWIHGTTWSFPEKPTVSGSVSHPDASVTITRSGAVRRIVSNGLPANHATGTFPIQQSDDAYQYDPMNQAPMIVRSIDVSIPAKPRKTTPSCAGGEVGVMTSGVVLNNAFDANGYDAAAHEMQDDCSGHPNNTNYHYHSLPLCIPSGKKGRHSKRVGWALDGFPIYGPLGEDGEYMRNDDLDACHGHTHRIKLDGKTRRLFHYHATQEFPYTVGCFRGTPATLPGPGP